MEPFSLFWTYGHSIEEICLSLIGYECLIKSYIMVLYSDFQNFLHFAPVLS